MKCPKKFRLLFSEGSEWVEKRLYQYTDKISAKDALIVSKKLYKNILKINEEIVEFGMPSHLSLSHVNALVHTGVFLKYDSDPIMSGSLIGVYTGRYELVASDLRTHNAYAYDVAQGISLKKKELSHVTRWDKPLDTKQDYSVQTNALEIGNFTRFINHSSLHPNVEAVVAKLPEGRMEVLLFALHDIAPGEQLLSNYGGEYWKALEIIPNDMAPDTYMLDNPYRAHLIHPIASFSSKLKQKLLSLRNSTIVFSDAIQHSSIVRKFKKHLPPIPGKKHQAKIESWEDTIVERALPREYVLERDKLQIAKSVKKGDFLGALAGTLSFTSKNSSILLAKTSKTELFLDLAEQGNCLQFLLQTKEKGNTKLYPMYDEETDQIFLVLLATKDIDSNHSLILDNFDLIIL